MGAVSIGVVPLPMWRRLGPSRRERVGERPANWAKEMPTTLCEPCGMATPAERTGSSDQKKSNRRSNSNNLEAKIFSPPKKTASGAHEHPLAPWHWPQDEKEVWTPSQLPWDDWHIQSEQPKHHQR